MSTLRPQTVSREEFQKLVAAHPNPVITADYTYQRITIGRREYRTLLQTRGAQ